MLDTWERESIDEVIAGNRFVAADHGARSRADVLRLVLRRLEA